MHQTIWILYIHDLGYSFPLNWMNIYFLTYSETLLVTAGLFLPRERGKEHYVHIRLKVWGFLNISDFWGVNRRNRYKYEETRNLGAVRRARQAYHRSQALKTLNCHFLYFLSHNWDCQWEVADGAGFNTNLDLRKEVGDWLKLSQENNIGDYI